MKYRYTPLQIEKMQTIKWLNETETASSGDLAMPMAGPVGVTKAQLAELEGKIDGRIVYPWSPEYDKDRQDFNNVYPSWPQLIVYVANYQDIRECLAAATSWDMITCVRSGGHSLASYSVCDGMVIDISSLKSLYVDPVAKTALVEAGNTFGDIYPKVELYGLHTPGGGCPTVSVAGFMQGGGYSLTSRTFGINCDTVLEVTVMLANGKIVVANENQNQDLYWAVRGGTGGNFGVLLSIKYKLFTLGDIWGIRITWDFKDDPTNAANALVAIQENYLTGFKFPDMGIETVMCYDIDDKGNVGDPMVYFGASFIGSETNMQAAIAPLMALPGAKLYTTYGKYSDVNSWVLEGIPNVPMDVQAYSRSAYISRSLSADDYKNILTFFLTSPNGYTMVDMEGYGGVINQYPVEKSAFIHRHPTMDFFCDVFFDAATNDQEACRLWIISFFDFMKQYGNSHSYQNYPNRDQEDWRWAYWGVYYNQLIAIKNKYDPGQFFRYGQYIGDPLTGHDDQKQLIIFPNPTPIQYENY